MKNILVSGAGLAGPAVAYWLSRYGFAVTVVERASELRTDGQAVDFRGAQNFSLLRKMGVLDAIKAKQMPVGGASNIINARGEKIAGLSASIAAGELEILRGDLSRILYDATLPAVKYVFGDSIAAIEDRHVTFDSGTRGEYDVIIGADGLHSNVRNIVFGDESQFVRPTGYFACIFSVDPELDAEKRIYTLPGGVLYNEPGRAAALGDDGIVLLIFASKEREDGRRDLEAQKRFVERAYLGCGWHVPLLLEHMRRAKNLYFDSISQVHMPKWWNERTVLLGDAGYGGTLGGMGASMAIVGGYVLAGELAATDSHELAFARYSAAIGDFARNCRKGSADVGRFMAPKTLWGLRLRNVAFRLFAALPGRGVVESILMKRASGINLKVYAEPAI